MREICPKTNSNMLKLNNPICFIGQFYSDEARIIGDKPPASNEWPIIGNGVTKGTRLPVLLRTWTIE